jgi:acyl carrier protein
VTTTQQSSTEVASVMQSLVGMITEVLGEEDFGIVPASKFKDDVGFESIQFIALAELIQEKYTDIDFVTWFSAKPLPEIVGLRVGDVADFIVASSRGE